MRVHAGTGRVGRGWAQAGAEYPLKKTCLPNVMMLSAMVSASAYPSRLVLARPASWCIFYRDAHLLGMFTVARQKIHAQGAARVEVATLAIGDLIRRPGFRTGRTRFRMHVELKPLSLALASVLFNVDRRARNSARPRSRMSQNIRAVPCGATARHSRDLERRDPG